MHYLRLSSLLLFLFLLSNCSVPYKNLHEDCSVTPSALRFQPVFDKVLYRCVVDGRVLFKKFHLSGLLFFKTMEDSSTRAVFQNEMGFTFFDFEWSPEDSFKVNQIIPQLDKPALVRTLQKDMNMFLMKNLDISSERVFRKDDETLHSFDLVQGKVYYIVEGKQLERIENTGKTKVITITMEGKTGSEGMPQTVFFNHHKANFTIQLTKLNTNADE